jgi:hypothetical protein
LTAGTLRQHAVAAEAIARGDLLFALSSGDPPPSAGEQLWLIPDGDDPGELAPTWQREAAAIAAVAPGVRCRCSVLASYPLDGDALGRIAGMHVWSEAHLSARLAAGEQLHALVVRAWAAPAGAPAAEGGTAGLPADDDLLPALTDAAFALLVVRLEEALAGAAIPGA